MEHIDGLTLRKALGTFPTGVTVMTTLDATGKACGITVNSFKFCLANSAFDPMEPIAFIEELPRVSGCRAVRRQYPLGASNPNIATIFGQLETTSFCNIVPRRGLGDVPIISSCAANPECVKISAHPEGDHVVYIGRVVRLERSEHRPLVFGNGRYLVARAHQQDERESVLLWSLRAATTR
ncbi:flavin reductase family protein [Cupriavidus basilensis]